MHAKEVVAEGLVLFAADEPSRLTFETEVLSAYARFCEERAPVMEAYSSAALHG